MTNQAYETTRLKTSSSCVTLREHQATLKRKIPNSYICSAFLCFDMLTLDDPSVARFKGTQMFSTRVSCVLPVLLFYTDEFELPLPLEHRFPMTKYRLLRERIGASDWGRECELKIPDGATDQQLCLVHDLEYVQRVVQGTLSERMIRRIGFPWSPELVERSRRSTGATIAAAIVAIESNSVSANLAGGTHHAFADRGEGYCVFNDVAVAARVLQTTSDVKHALVVDCDVHQGNGTAAIFTDDSSVTTFSMHGRKNYPLKKMVSDLDIPLDRGIGDEVYLEELDRALKTLLPSDVDFVFYVSGADPYAGDSLGHLSLTKDGLRCRDELVFSYFRELGIPMAVAMAGGYAPNVEDIVDIHAMTIETALKYA